MTYTPPTMPDTRQMTQREADKVFNTYLSQLASDHLHRQNQKTIDEANRMTKDK